MFFALKIVCVLRRSSRRRFFVVVVAATCATAADAAVIARFVHTQWTSLRSHMTKAKRRWFLDGSRSPSLFLSDNIRN